MLFFKLRYFLFLKKCLQQEKHELSLLCWEVRATYKMEYIIKYFLA